MTTRKCERYARERHANAKSFHACVSCFQTAKSLEKTFKTTLKQNNTKIWAAYAKTEQVGNIEVNITGTLTQGGKLKLCSKLSL